MSPSAVDQQMLPIDSHLADSVDVEAIGQWIDFMTTANGYPPAAP